MSLYITVLCLCAIFVRDDPCIHRPIVPSVPSMLRVSVLAVAVDVDVHVAVSADVDVDVCCCCCCHVDVRCMSLPPVSSRTC